MHTHRLAGAACLTALALFTASCSSDNGVELEAPIFVTVDNLDGAEIEITQHQPMIVPVGENKDAALWTEGAVADESVATFEPGRSDGSSSHNPGFHAVSQGTTAAELTNPESGETYTFTLVVK